MRSLELIYMNYAEFNKIIKEDKFSKDDKTSYPFLFRGMEIYLIEDSIKRIKNKYIDKSTEALNYTVLNGKNIHQDDIINACETLPLMSEKKLVILNEPSLFLQDGITNEKEFYKYLDNIGDHCIFIITDRSDGIDKRTKFYQYFKKKDLLVEFNKLGRPQLRSWIKNLLKRNKKSMTDEDISYFIENSSYLNKYNDTEKDLYSLKSDLEKLINYSNAAEISKKDIDTTGKKTMDSNIFDLLNYINDGKTEMALQVFNNLYSFNEPVLRILFMIIRQARLLISYKLYSDKGYNDNQIASIIKIKPYELKKISQQSRKHDLSRLKKHFDHLLLVDKKLKTSSTDERIEMEMLIIRISSGAI